jgi:hypothetical protein
MVTKSNDKTSENTYIYIGYDADFPNITVSAGAWYPSTSKYMIVTIRTYGSTFTDVYTFSINSDNTLPGIYKFMDKDYTSNLYPFIIPASHKSPLGSWEMLMESQSDRIGINDIMEKKITEDQKVQAQRTESAVPVDAVVISKVKELKAIIKKTDR